MRERQKKRDNDDAVFFNFCYTVLTVFALGLFVTSIYGIVDAHAKTSSKKAQDIQDKIEAWQTNVGDEYAQ